MGKKIEIIDKLSSESYKNIELFFGFEINSILLNTAKGGASLNSSFKQATFSCQYLNFVRYDYRNNRVNKFLINSTFKNQDTRSSYSRINFVKEIEDDLDLNSLYKKDVFAFQLPSGTFFVNADIYGVSCVNEVLDFDEDFPENKTLISNDSDCMIKLNTKSADFILIWAKEESIYISLGHTEESFKEYLQMTRRVWGEHQGYKFKYSIKP